MADNSVDNTDIKIEYEEKVLIENLDGLRQNIVANAVNNIIGIDLTYEEKVFIKNLGAPRPDMVIIQEDKRKNYVFSRKFTKQMYASAKWLCGCDLRNAFFCFVCLLINSDDSDTAWTERGVTDLKHLGEKVKRHKLSVRHLHNEIEFAIIGRSNIQTQLDSAYRLSIKEHNEHVKKNRYILNEIVDCFKFCGAFELVNECVDSPDSGVLKGLVHLLAEIDSGIKDPLTAQSAFAGISKTLLQNEILDSILHVCREIIRNEIEDADFLALQVDETDSASKQQMVLIYRYEIKGQIYERFWGLFCPENHTADGLSTVILEQLQAVNVDKNPNILISQSYDGALVTRESTGGVQIKIKSIYERANFIHCYAHQLNLIIEKAASQIRKVKVFFANLEAFPAYFSRSAKRMSIFSSFMEKRMPMGNSNSWNFNIRTVTIVYKYREHLIQFFEEIINNETDNTMIRESTALKSMLSDSEFIFWLNIFNKIMPHVDNLNNHLEQRKLNPLNVKVYISEFKKSIQRVRNGIDKLCDTMPTPSKRPKTEDCNKVVAKEVCDIIVSCVEDRFEFSDHLALALLVCPEMFAEYRLCFPEKTFQIALGAYPFLDNQKLHQELLVLYNRKDFCTFTSASSLLQIFLENNLIEPFSETVKVLKIVCTIPMATVESERCFLTLKRIKTFLQSTMCQDRLAALTMCLIEKDLIQRSENFNNRVVEHFINQEGRNDFMYKSYS